MFSYHDQHGAAVVLQLIKKPDLPDSVIEWYNDWCQV